MKKSIIPVMIAALAGLGVYAVYTASQYPENSVEYPRVPDSSFTQVISKMLGGDTNSLTKSIKNNSLSGVVTNSLALGGIPGNSYLKRGAGKCLLTGDVWKGIDQSGKPLCGPKLTQIVQMGTLDEVSCPVKIYQSSGSVISAGNGSPVYNTDIIDTSSCMASIVFTDASVIRLNTNTTLELALTDIVGAPADAPKQIAQIIIDRGELWGRILTTTGSYNIGNRDIVGAIRGTAINIKNVNANTTIREIKQGSKTIGWNTINSDLYAETNITIHATTDIHANSLQRTKEYGERISYSEFQSDSSNNMVSDLKKYEKKKGRRTLAQSLDVQNDSNVPTNRYTLTQGNDGNIKATGKQQNALSVDDFEAQNDGQETQVAPKTPDTAFSQVAIQMNDWVRENTKKDLVYMHNYLINHSGSIDEQKRTKIIAEIHETIPKTFAECSELMQGPVIGGGGTLNQDICSSLYKNNDTNTDYNNTKKQTICALKGQEYKASLEGHGNTCVPIRTKLVMDFTTNIKDGNIGNTLGNEWEYLYKSSVDDFKKDSWDLTWKDKSPTLINGEGFTGFSNANGSFLVIRPFQIKDKIGGNKLTISFNGTGGVLTQIGFVSNYMIQKGITEGFSPSCKIGWNAIGKKWEVTDNILDSDKKCGNITEQNNEQITIILPEKAIDGLKLLQIYFGNTYDKKSPFGGTIKGLTIHD